MGLLVRVRRGFGSSFRTELVFATTIQMIRDILLCTLGGSWAVVPEVYAFLAPNRLPLYDHHPQRVGIARTREQYRLRPPTEIWICTTQGAQTRPGIVALLKWRDLLPYGPVMRIWEADGTDQLATQQECDHLQELLLRACLLAHEEADGGQVVLSLAGGRKTMSADLQWAGHLVGCHALVHVVGQDPLPELLKAPCPETLVQPLPADVCPSVVPLVAGQGRRSELLDVDLDGNGAVCAARFPLPLPDVNSVVAWPAPRAVWLRDEVRERERAGSRLFGNYLVSLAQHERHENWRSLYRLPPRLIDALRRKPIGPDLADWLRALPKAELHRHVGGCLDILAQREVGRAVWESLTTDERKAAAGQVRSLLKHSNWPADWPEVLRHDVPRANCAAALLVHAGQEQLDHNLFAATSPRFALRTRHPLGFAAYERPGELSGSTLLSHPAAIEPYAEQIVRQAVAEGLMYVELRGSPNKYGDGLAFLRSFSSAIQKAAARLPPAERPIFRFIIIADRRQRATLSEVIALAVQGKQEMDDFVAGLDMAGDEATVRPEEIADCFLPAFEVCLPLTIHAGEGERADSIWQAAYHLHADRIGHGLTIGEHPQLTGRFRDRSICLELCPTSNREVVGFRDPTVPESAGAPEYPLETLWREGLPLTICTDNPGISRTTLADEYLVAARMAKDGLHCWDVLAMIKQAFMHAFLPSRDKGELLKRADALIYRLVLHQFPMA
jgi:adenosine deaminase